MIRRIVPAVLFACASGCAPVETDPSWLFIVAGDTVTVEDAAAHWDSLAPGELRVFDGSEDLKGDYVRAYSRMFLIRSELHSQGYLDRPGFVVQREALARIRMMNALQDSIYAGAHRAVTGADIGVFPGGSGQERHRHPFRTRRGESRRTRTPARAPSGGGRSHPRNGHRLHDHPH